MATDDADDLVSFRDVRVVRATPPALLCRVGEKTIWLPRAHISGKLWCRGDRGTLLIRRWVAREQHLIDGDAVSIGSASLAPPAHRPSSLRRVRRGRNTHSAD